MSTTMLLLACGIALTLGACKDPQSPPIPIIDPSQKEHPEEIASAANANNNSTIVDPDLSSVNDSSSIIGRSLGADRDAVIYHAVWQASENWQRAFNHGDAAACANHYEETAVMRAARFGTFIGKPAIEKFWQQLIDDGLSDVRYINPRIIIVDKDSAVLTANWKMNKAAGLIYRELWVMQPDGRMKLREDEFEAIATPES
jgi:ketosteroid isomerase-like protein